ncbi:hypothetical protein HPP92_010879 [Vanilla planifolia]|uniref:Uncharacterized protein n=1 Tax=Vanilla planifolia TaxID=51239 RepID=A0A835QZV4_VANPL|nr:hypothetical protein HPP92_011150 [Vanilla planifolia]KAG0482795.1 hypothetical protein HPP92_010879 [Vanilla planifolia]
MVGIDGMDGIDGCTVSIAPAPDPPLEEDEDEEVLIRFRSRGALSIWVSDPHTTRLQPVVLGRKA